MSMLRFSIIAACLAYSLWRAGRDYLFYLRNKWDFTKDSGISYDWNSDGQPRIKGNGKAVRCLRFFLDQVAHWGLFPSANDTLSHCDHKMAFTGSLLP